MEVTWSTGKRLLLATAYKINCILLSTDTFHYVADKLVLQLRKSNVLAQAVSWQPSQ